MELEQALVEYRAQIEKVLGGIEPPPTQKWLTETVDRIMAQFTDGNGNGKRPTAASA